MLSSWSLPALPTQPSAYPARPACELLREPEHVVHVEPAALADDPLRGKERATREGAAIAGRVRQRNRIRRTVEARRVDARDEARARGRDVNRPWKAGLLHHPLEHQRRSRR